MMIAVKMVMVFIIAYLIGSIPTGYLIVKAKKGVDIRETGSGSTGATNVKRILGTKWFFTVMILDALKGVISVLIAKKYFDLTYDITLAGLAPILASLGVIIGHSKSIFLKFTGGKSVATGVGTILGLCWPVGLITAAIWGIITYTSKYVSLGSIIAITLAPVLMRMFNQNEYYIWFTAICAAFVVIRHKDNIVRLCQGKENKVRK